MSFGDRFLTEPALFPARAAGEAWGNGRLALRFAGGPYLVTGLARDQEDVLRDRFAGFLAPEAQAGAGGVHIAVLRADAGEFRRFDMRGWEMTLDMERAAASVRLAGVDIMGRLAWAPQLSGALWTPAAGGDAFHGAFENFLRALCAYRLLELGGALLHSAGIDDGRDAWLFLGPSGAGKSTVSRMAAARGLGVLSDDLNALWFEDGRPVLAPIPFAGDFGRRGLPAPAARPLRGFYRLQQGLGDQATPLGAGAALSTLVACAPFVNQDPFRLDALMTTLARLVAGCPAHLLTFTLSGGCLDLVQAAPTAARAAS